jgi:hypothetical protein
VCCRNVAVRSAIDAVVSVIEVKATADTDIAFMKLTVLYGTVLLSQTAACMHAQAIQSVSQ